MSTETKPLTATPLTPDEIADLKGFFNHSCDKSTCDASAGRRHAMYRRVLATIDALTAELAEMRLRVRPCACPYCPSGCGRMSQPESDPPVCGECQHGEHVCAVAELAAARRKLEEAPNLVPSNWTDPILTGPHSVFHSKDSPEQNVERVLRAVKQQLTDLTEGEAQDGDK